MKVEVGVTYIDEPTYVANIEGYMAGWVQQQFGSLETSIPRGYAKDKRSTIKCIWPVHTGPDRRRDLASVDHGVGLIGYLRRIIRNWISRTRRLRQRMEPCLGSIDGRRLPLPKAIRRSDRVAHEAQTTSGDSGGDDD
jgi:hypothetical protein